MNKEERNNIQGKRKKEGERYNIDERITEGREKRRGEKRREEERRGEEGGKEEECDIEVCCIWYQVTEIDANTNNIILT